MKRRWEPKYGDKYFMMNERGDVSQETWEESNTYDYGVRNHLGVYPDEESAIAMRDKIREFVTGIIGSV